MSAPHFIAPLPVDGPVLLRGDEARHASRVLRIRPGETITVTDGSGTVVTAVVRESAGREVVADVVERREVPAPRPRLVVWQGLPKAGKLDLIVQKLTEVGAAAVVPFAAERSVSRWDGKEEAKLAHLRGVAREAAKQSRRAHLLDVLDPAPLGAVRAPALVLHEEATLRLRDALPGEPPDEIALVVGPEGGLTAAEVAALAAAGAVPVTLGPAVLRTETAPLAAAVLALGAYGLLG